VRTVSREHEAKLGIWLFALAYQLMRAVITSSTGAM